MASRPCLSALLGVRAGLPGQVFAGQVAASNGQVVAGDGFTLFPLYHPAAALRSTRLRETLFEDARRLRGEAAHGGRQL